jgi:hypothetical protein
MIERAFGAFRIPRNAIPGPEGGKTLPATGENLVCIGLVPHIEEQLVLRKIERP